MSEEYQRLQEAARDVEREIADLEQNHRVNSAAEHRLPASVLSQRSCKSQKARWPFEYSLRGRAFVSDNRLP